MAGGIDLHMHSFYSDGEHSPEYLAAQAKNAGLRVISLTDHDTVKGLSGINGIELVTGIEISCDERDNGFDDIHILGYFIDTASRRLSSFLERVEHERTGQKREMIRKLQQFGVKISFEEVRRIAKGEIGRPHIAKVALMNNPDKFNAIEDVFREYIGVGKKAYCTRNAQLTLADTIELVHSAGGLAFIAHPGVYIKKDSLKLISMFRDLGGDGIETIYPYSKVLAGSVVNGIQEKKIISSFRRLARSGRLLESGGNDFHGSIRPTKIGGLPVPYSFIEAMRIRLGLGI
ncbi:PHP domain-containing protein [Candidatus Woesearchaeota archaeon]|nr:PHP domain-containing protein [Candidatus Woesearchaeota archaeon]